MKKQKVSIVHLQMVKDAEIIYGHRRMENPREAASLVKSIPGDMDRECLVVCAIDTKLKPTHLQITAVGSGKLLGIRLMDHIILGDGDNFYSFRESGRFLGLQGID